MGAKRYLHAALTYQDTETNLESEITAIKCPDKKTVTFSGLITRNNANMGTFSIPITYPDASLMTLSIPGVTTPVKETFADNWVEYAQDLSNGLVDVSGW